MSSDAFTSQPAVHPPAGAPPPTSPGWLRLAAQYRIPLLAGLAVVVVVCASALVWVWHGRQSADQAFQMLAIARAPAQWEEIVKQHPRTPAAPMALLALANAKYHAGAYDAAQEAYRQFQALYPGHKLALTAELGLAMCREARGDTAEALADFERLLSAHPKHYLAPQALLGKARCLARQQDYAAARAVYENFILENPESAWNTQAEMALTMLQRAERAAGSAPAVKLDAPAASKLPAADTGSGSSSTLAPASTPVPTPTPETDS